MDNYTITGEFKFDDIEVTLREMDTREYLKLKKAKDTEDMEKMLDFFEEYLSKMIIKSNKPEITVEELSKTITGNFNFFSKLIEDYSNFLSNTKKKKK
jgi:hypothetical protein